MGFLLVGLALLPFGPATGHTAFDLVFPDTVSVEGRTLRLNGVGLRTVTILHIRIYAAALYVPVPSREPSVLTAESGPKMLLFHFLHDGTRAQVEKAFRDAIDRNCAGGDCPAEETAQIEQLIAAFPAVQAGDTAAYVFTESGVRTIFNDRLLIEIPNPRLARGLLASFLGPHAPSESLRDGLLGRLPGSAPVAIAAPGPPPAPGR